jgi:hypothetical protein
MEPKSRVTLKLIAGAATLLFRLRGVFIVIAVAAGIWFGWSVFGSEFDSATALIPLAVLLWSVLALGIGYLLPGLPPAIGAGDRFWVRTKKRCILLGYGLAVASALILGGFALLLSLRALTLAGG